MTSEREKNLLRRRVEGVTLRFAVATVDHTQLYGSITYVESWGLHDFVHKLAHLPDSKGVT